MSSLYMSKDARRVAESIGKYGVMVDYDHLFNIELACSFFHTNHIVKVIEQVMRGGNAGSKLLKAQEHGWPYFSKPIYSILTPRNSARRGRDPASIASIGEKNFKVWRTVIRTLLLADMNREEADYLIFDLPEIITEYDALHRAIAACKARDSRTVYYLRGVLERERQAREGRKREILQNRETNTPFEIPQGYEEFDLGDLAQLQARWNEQVVDSEIIESLNEFARKNASN